MVAGVESCQAAAVSGGRARGEDSSAGSGWRSGHHLSAGPLLLNERGPFLSLGIEQRGGGWVTAALEFTQRSHKRAPTWCGFSECLGGLPRRRRNTKKLLKLENEGVRSSCSKKMSLWPHGRSNRSPHLQVNSSVKWLAYDYGTTKYFVISHASSSRPQAFKCYSDPADHSAVGRLLILGT